MNELPGQEAPSELAESKIELPKAQNPMLFFILGAMFVTLGFFCLFGPPMPTDLMASIFIPVGLMQILYGRMLQELNKRDLIVKTLIVRLEKLEQNQ